MLPQTDRLIPSPLTPAHWFDVRTMHTNVEAMATLGGVRSEERSQQWMTENLEHWRVHGFGMCPWYLRDGGEFVGLGGLRTLALDDGTEVEVGYGLLPTYWGKGLATEIAQGCIATGFSVMGLRSIVALTMTDNLASRHVMEKSGLRFERSLMHANLPHVLYRIDIEEGL
jgi:[ribosomal protein S5]-alanine N-acetyltransferase